MSTGLRRMFAGLLGLEVQQMPSSGWMRMTRRLGCQASAALRREGLVRHRAGTGSAPRKLGTRRRLPVRR